MTCFGGDPEECPGCGATPPPVGWEPLRATPYPFLGKCIDGRYLLDRYLGGGTSGRVFRARDVKLDRPFALKILDLGTSGERSLEESMRRFENEVEALSRIRNPHVINIYESYRLEESTAAMLTEYIEGVTLAEMLEGDNRLEVDSALTLIHQVANGLYEAHTQGIVHRDIKPANIMVEQLPATGSFARILDFGLVYLADGAGQTRGFWGTPLYAAPEQCAPGPPITPEADIYSLGCVLYYCVAGRPPFLGRDPRAIMRAHVDEEPRRLQEVVDGLVPDRLDEIVAAMLEKSPDDRPEDMSEVIDTIEPLAKGTRGWEQSVVTESQELAADETEVDEEMGAVVETVDGTRIGVAETHAPAPQLAQLQRSFDLGARTSEFSGALAACTLDPTGDCAVLADTDARVFVLNTSGDAYFQSLAPAPSELRDVATKIDRGLVYAADDQGRLLRWGLRANASSPKVVTEVDIEVECMMVGERGQHLYLGGSDGRIMRHDLRLGSSRTIADSLSAAITAIHVSRDGNFLLAATESGDVHGRSEPSETGFERLANFDSGVSSLTLESESGVAAALDIEDRLSIFHVRGSFEEIAIEPAVECLRVVAIAPGRQLIAISADEPDIRIWRIRQETLAERVPGFQNVGRKTQGPHAGMGR